RVPAGADVLWTVRFLPDSARSPTILLLVVGIIVALLTIAGQQSAHHPLAILAELYVDLMRGIPMLVIILYVGFPLHGAIKDMTGGFIDMSSLTRGVVGIALGYAAYMAEIFRAGIQAIPKGQVEASRSLGLSGWQTARFVVLPQALKIVIPPLGNEFIAMLKDTSLLSVISLREMTQRTREFMAATFEVFTPFNTVAILYIVMTLAASSLIKFVERRTEAEK
ncbi:MAG TPA: amino acid ABC transporter permease, partial [Trueperaceae bacterium]